MRGSLLRAPQRRVTIVMFQQRLMRPPLDDYAMIKHHDFVGVHNRRKAMCNNKCRVSSGNVLQIVEDLPFGPAVQ